MISFIPKLKIHLYKVPHTMLSHYLRMFWGKKLIKERLTVSCEKHYFWSVENVTIPFKKHQNQHAISS